MVKEGRGLPWPGDKDRQRRWHDRALDYGRAHDSFWENLPGSPEFLTWAAYFDALGWRPVTFPRGVDRRGVVLSSAAGTRSWTAPCRWPKDLEGRS